MRTPSFCRAHSRAAVLAALGLAGLLAVPIGGAALAAPAPADVTVSIGTAEQQLAALGRRIDLAVENYDTARIALAAAQRKAAAADAGAARARSNFLVEQAQLTGFAASAYRDGTTGGVAAMVTSTPGDYLDRMSTLDVVSQREADILRAVDAARRSFDSREAMARGAAGDALAVTQRLAATKASIETQIATERHVLDGLRGIQAQQQQLAAAKAAAARAAAQHAGSTGSPSNTTSRSTGSSSRHASAPTSHVPVSGRAAAAVKAAYSALGRPYVYGASGPGSFDCSGLTMWAWAQAGVSLPHSSSMQYSSGRHVSQSDLQPGDLLFFYSPISHVGMYVGGGKMIHAPHTGSVVSLVTPMWGDFAGAVRPG